MVNEHEPEALQALARVAFGSPRPAGFTISPAMSSRFLRNFLIGLVAFVLLLSVLIMVGTYTLEPG